MRGVDGSEEERSLSGAQGGPAARLLTPGVALFAAEETVLAAMLEGWELQQRSRMLSGLCLVRGRSNGNLGTLSPPGPLPQTAPPPPWMPEAVGWMPVPAQ